MKLLTRLALGGFDGFSVYRCQRPIGLRRSSHLVPDRGRPREQPSDGSPEAAAAATANDRRWVLLNCSEYRRDDSLAADGKTVAESRTSTGRPLLVSFGLAPPPASSVLLYNCKGAVSNYKGNDLFTVITAHGDTALLRMVRKLRGSRTEAYDHFVYRAAGTGTPPSLSLLRPRDIPMHYEVKYDHPCVLGRDPACRVLPEDNTGLLRRGDGELLVVQLEARRGDSGRPVADLFVLRLGADDQADQQWELKRAVPIEHGEGEEGDQALYCWGWSGDTVIPVGDRFLCWVLYHRGVIVCDMAVAAAEEVGPRLRYLPMPVPYDADLYSDDLPPMNDMNVGAAGDGAVRLVSIETRCCCGGPGRSSCARSRFAFTVTTWTLTLAVDDDEPMAWVKDGVLDCEELWALPGYEGRPRVHLQCPIVSLENPDVVYFKLSDYQRDEGPKVWIIEVDTRRKALLSVLPYATDPWKGYSRIQAKV